VRWTRGHQADAQDLLADAYLRVVRNTGRNTLLPDNPIAWMSAIIANLARDYLRAKSRGIRRRAGDSDDLETLRDPNCDSDTTFITRELLWETLDRVQTLSAAQRRALLARSTGEEYDAIAAQLATTPANARKLVQTARRQLRDQLSPHERQLIAGSRKHDEHAGTA
jgi:RNA polymerase sigma-70 factor (ECF subfamily)